MREGFHYSLGIVILLIATGTAAVVAREYRQCENGCKALYTSSLKQRDMLEAARNGFAALSDAEIREAAYVLTGETSYSEAFAEDVRNWRDEVDSLNLISLHDRRTPIVQGFSKAGGRTMEELKAVVVTCEKQSREAALARIAKGSGAVYLDQAHASLNKLAELAGSLDLAYQPIQLAFLALKRSAASAAVLFALVIVSTLLFLVSRASEKG